MAPRHDHTDTWHGRTFVDPYHWLREKGSPEMVKYLEAEKAYTDATTADLKVHRRFDARLVSLSVLMGSAAQVGGELR